MATSAAPGRKKRSRNLLLLFILFNILVVAIAYNRMVEATGGAFTSTKHGGATTDGETPHGGGVDRGVNTDVGHYGGLGAYDNATGAGVYAAGECGHCHEMHASFGGSEPAPNASTGDTAGPTAYLLMKGDYNSGTQGSNSNLCWYCHEKLSNINTSGSALGYGRWEFYQGKAIYEFSSHGSSASVSWPGVANLYNPVSVWPRQDKTGLNAGNIKSCMTCHTPHGLAGAAYDEGGTPTQGDATYNVNNNTLDTSLIPRQLIAREEALCLNCHDGTPAAGGNISPGTGDIKTQVDRYLAASGSGHPVRSGSYYNRHNLAGDAGTYFESNINPPTAPGWALSAGAHAECTDCHNPHAAQGYGTGAPIPYRGTVFQWSGTATFHANRVVGAAGVKIGAVNKGVWGISVSTSTGAYSSSISSLDPNTHYVYELCFKCHSDWAWNGSANQPTAPSTTKTWTGAYMPSNKKMTNVPADFANTTTVNQAWHPVYGVGRNMPENSNIKNPFYCEENAGTAPDATTMNFSVGCTTMAEGTRNDLVGSAARTLSQNFVPPWKHTSIITCVDCHQADNVDNAGTIARGPHGSARPFILRGLQPNISYTLNNGAGGAMAASYTSLPVCSKKKAAGGTEFTKCPSNSTGSQNIVTMAPNNFCLNCHRADVYGYDGVVGDKFVPRFYLFPRQRHPADWAKGGMRALLRASDDGGVGDAPRGIVCLRCHGGGLGSGFGGGVYNKLGLIHGTPNGTPTAGTTIGRALIAGSDWAGYTPGTTTTKMSCGVLGNNPTFNSCGHHGTPTNVDSGTYANYDYTP